MYVHMYVCMYVRMPWALSRASNNPSGAISMDRARTVEEGVMEPYVTGEVIAVQSAASVVPYVPPPPPGPPPPFVALGFEYYMNGRHTGRLYLDHVHHRCAWSNNITRRTTDWHGEWHKFPSGILVCIFDFDGRKHAKARSDIPRLPRHMCKRQTHMYEGQLHLCKGRPHMCKGRPHMCKGRPHMCKGRPHNLRM